MGLTGGAALVGAAQYRPERYSGAPRMFHLEQVADLGAQALLDAGIELSEVDGLILPGPLFHEANMFVPAMAAEYLGVAVDYAEVVDLGGRELGRNALARGRGDRDGTVQHRDLRDPCAHGAVCSERGHVGVRPRQPLRRPQHPLRGS